MRRIGDGLGALWVLSVGALALGASACADRGDTKRSLDAPASSQEAVRGASEARADEVGASARLEHALRSLDRGADAAAAKTELEGVLADGRATVDEQDEARLGLSRAREALGDKEGAIGAVEELLASHADDRRFAAREPAEKRLRLLLTGSESEGPSFQTAEKYAPVARALASYFSADEHGETLVDVLTFGHGGQHLEELGALAIPAAKRDALRQACTLCEDNLKVYTSISRTGSWIDVARFSGDIEPTMPQIDRSLVIFYFDLGANRVPSRYDEYLPLPSADIVAHLEKGEGLIAMRERKGAKPTLVIAAPRVGQLAAVEDAFAKLGAIPKEPMTVSLEPKLSPDEIQSVVRASFGDIRRCYESLLERDAHAEGKVVVHFEITAEGGATNVSTDDGKSETKTTLVDPAMQECVTGVVARLKFPATGRTTTVAYPIAFSPGGS